ncbi:MAG: D-aminoacyl-tRNA deacylase [Akkermansiaceae bacterium]
MRVILQRVLEASVTVDGEIVSKIAKGLLVFLGIEEADTSEDLGWLSEKVARLRIFEDSEGKMNQSLIDQKGDLLVVSQFTLYANTKKGNRPSFIKAAHPDQAKPFYEQFCTALELKINKPVRCGIFGADMKVALANDGPVTIFIDSKNRE